MQVSLMIVLGVLVFVWPALVTAAVDVYAAWLSYIGWLFLISGIVGLVAVFSANDIPAFLRSLDQGNRPLPQAGRQSPIALSLKTHAHKASELA